MRPFESARLKLVRAREHLAAREAEQLAYAESGPFNFVGELDGATGTSVVRVRFREGVDRPPAHLGLVGGDVAHALRSTLDHMAWELAGDSASDRTQWPILTQRFVPDRANPDKSRDAWTDSVARHLVGVADRDLDVIRTAQPFNLREVVERGETVSEGDDLARLAYLSGVARLDNRDKHRVAPVSSPVMVRHVPEFSGIGALGVRYEMRDGPVMLTEGLELFRILWADTTPSLNLGFSIPDPYTLIDGSEHLDLSAHWTDNTLVQMSSRDLTSAAELIEDLMARF